MQEKSKLEAELNFLSALEQGNVVTQMTLSKRVAVSVGLINALLRRAVHKGYVKTSAAPYKRYAYYLTPQGFSEKSRLVAEYLEFSLDFFRKARREYLDLFQWAGARGLNRIVFAGSGELVEIALSAMREVDLQAEVIICSQTNENHVSGLLVVRSVADLPEFDAIVITDARAPQRTFDWLSEHVPLSKIVTPSFLHITRERPDFKPKVIRQ